MHIALLAPFSNGPIRGNIITVQRIARYLQQQGLQAELLPLDQIDQPQLDRRLIDHRPDLLHAFHAFHAAPLAREAAQRHGIPYLVTITGSDLFDPQFRDHPATRLALTEARAVICFDETVADHLRCAFDLTTATIAIIPQGVEITIPSPSGPHPADTFTILLPAALRPVKGIVEAIDALTPLAASDKRLRLKLAGGDLDQEYSRRVALKVRTLDWVELLGEVPHDAMGALYAGCDVVLNSSHFEGGMANSLLEAMAWARPVIASDVPGNRSLIRDGATGLLYRGSTDLQDKLRQLMQQPDRCAKIGRAAHDYVVSKFSAEQEATALVALYRRILT